MNSRQRAVELDLLATTFAEWLVERFIPATAGQVDPGTNVLDQLDAAQSWGEENRGLMREYARRLLDAERALGADFRTGFFLAWRVSDKVRELLTEAERRKQKALLGAEPVLDAESMFGHLCPVHRTVMQQSDEDGRWFCLACAGAE